MPRRIGLGRGLEALLDNNEEEKISATPEEMLKHSLLDMPDSPAAGKTVNQRQEIVQLPIDKLIANPGQPRKNFDETELQELADSIKQYGVIQPIIAANADGMDAGDTYIIVAGERRTRAAKLAGLQTIPAVIRGYTDQKQLEVSLIENIQRTDLNPIEEAAAYKNLLDFSEQTYGKQLSQDELASRVGKNRSTIANALRLLKLPAEIQNSVIEGKVTSGHARALLSVTNTKTRDKLYKEIIASGLSVRETEKRVAVINAEKQEIKTKKNNAAKKGSKRPPEIDAMEEKFIGKLGTKVVIEGGMHKGRILIDYYSMEDLERLYEILG